MDAGARRPMALLGCRQLRSVDSFVVSLVAFREVFICRGGSSFLSPRKSLASLRSCSGREKAFKTYHSPFITLSACSIWPEGNVSVDVRLARGLVPTAGCVGRLQPAQPHRSGSVLLRVSAPSWRSRWVGQALPSRRGLTGCLDVVLESPSSSVA